MGGCTAHALCHPQKVDRKDPWVGLLAWKLATRLSRRVTGRFTFPDDEVEWSIEAAGLHSQWRDRAGLAPVFPVMPSWAPKAMGASYHGRSRRVEFERRPRRGLVRRRHAGTRLDTTPARPPRLNRITVASHVGRRLRSHAGSRL